MKDLTTCTCLLMILMEERYISPARSLTQIRSDHWVWPCKRSNIQRRPEGTSRHSAAMAASLSGLRLQECAHYLARLGDEEKLELYESADVALNPMLSGSGTNIKMLDYMAAGLPVISSSTGARGLEIESYTHTIVCELPDFPGKIRDVLEDDQLRSRLIVNGRKLVQDKYDWKRIAEDMDQTPRCLT